MMEYTEEQKRAIEAEGRVIVSASAGSGKTKIMIERILRLVCSGRASLSEILAVTFTKKAAFQMKERLRAALLDEIKKSAGAQRENLKRELDYLGIAEISTVHSLCGRLIRTYFYLLPEEDISPDFRILSAQDAAGLSNRALTRVIEGAFEAEDGRYQPVLDAYYRGKRQKSLRAVVADTYGKVRGYENGEELLMRAGEDKFDEAAQFLADDYRRRTSSFTDVLSVARETFRGSKGAIKVCDALEAAVGALKSSRTPFETAQAEFEFPRMPNRPKEEGEREIYDSLKEINEGVKGIFKEIRTQFQDEKREREKYLAAAKNAKSLASLCLAYGTEYARLKREANAFDYDDLEHFALALLKKEEARAEIKKKYRYTFVDEYQDVNPMQERIVSLLAGENLFLVGDEKQAIYGFRGSKSRYFREKRKEFGGALPLTENFRSAKGILSAVNRVFAPVVEGYEPMRGGRLYDGHEGEIFSHRVTAAEEGEKPVRSVYSVAGAKGDKKKNALAEAVVRVVESERDRTYYDLDTKSFRRTQYGDIAILVRKDTTDGRRIAAALTEHGIPVTSSSGVNVCDFFETRILIDCLKFLDNAEADIPLAAVMLSAIGGFTDGDLMRIRLEYPKYSTFRAAARAYAEKCKDELAHRLNLFFRKAKRLRALGKVRTAAETLSELLSAGLEVEIASKEDGVNRLNRVRRFVAEAEKCGGVHEFLAYLKGSDEKVTFSESGGEDAVRVMTMHASKGLEFPVVVLASTETPLHDSDPSEVEWSERFLFSPRYYDFEKKTYAETVGRRATAAERAIEEDEGERNLLYVAMTRAKYRLHLMVEERRRASSPAFYKRFSDYFGSEFLGDESDEIPPPLEREAFDYETQASEAEKERVLKAMQIGSEYPYRDSVYLPQKSSATALLKQRQELLENKRDFVGGGSAEEGTAYHRFLEHYSFGADVLFELSRMQREGILSEEECARMDTGKLTEIANIPCLAALAGKECERERKFLLSLTPEETGGSDADTAIIFQGAIDLLVLDDGGYVVYDYKFSVLGADALREKYRPQIELYKDAVAKGKRVDRGTVRAKIINIRSAEVIEM